MVVVAVEPPGLRHLSLRPAALLDAHEPAAGRTAELEDELDAFTGSGVAERVLLRAVRRAFGEVADLALAQYEAMPQVHVATDRKAYLLEVVAVARHPEVGILKLLGESLSPRKTPGRENPAERLHEHELLAD
ncbi:hypothetical protein [Streptomyces sp. NBC_00035]|uniref:hypothetical protein n=1 Tax=Streptomyces sp. NBC_00035 TaxID=2903614 RepID=UPI0032558A2A